MTGGERNAVVIGTGARDGAGGGGSAGMRDGSGEYVVEGSEVSSGRTSGRGEVNATG